MHPSASDKSEFRTIRDGVVDALGDPRVQDDLHRAADRIPGPGTPRERVTRELGVPIGESHSSGGEQEHVPYFARAPLPSLVQSHIEEALGGEGILPDHPESFWARLVNSVEHALGRTPGSYTPTDPDWYVFIAKGVLEHLARGNAPFNPHPAEHDLRDDARLVLVGDWGTGLQRARDVASQMQHHIASALGEGRQVHAIHLGDVYYSGLPDEDQRHFLQWWPVTQEQADAGVLSWSLNGNHDMYSGGFGYFDTLLADPRFAAQRAGGGATSFFRLKGGAWDFVGLDTAWDSNVMSFGASGVLEDPQGRYVAEVAGESDRKLALMSHHQLVSVYDPLDLGTTLPDKLHGVLAEERVTAWWWGHEHRAISFGADKGVRYPRCLGNGGVPTAPDPTPPPGSQPAITWHSTRTTVENGHRWTRSGFAVLDLHGDRIEVQYVDDDGRAAHTETVV